jgi:hypothetical protein
VTSISGEGNEFVPEKYIVLAVYKHALCVCAVHKRFEITIRDFDSLKQISKI